MEVTLLIVVIILLIFQNTRYTKESLSLKNDLKILNDKLNSLLANYNDGAKTVEKEMVKEEVLKPVAPPVEPPFVAPPTIATPTVQDVIKEKEEDLHIAEKLISDKKPVMAAARVEEVPYEPQPSFWERFKERNPDLEKFIGENLINKIGILILVLGISYFVKFAIDKDWINEPARVGIGILAGSLVLFIAHKLRQKYAPL